MRILSFRGRIGRAAFSLGLLGYLVPFALITGLLGEMPDGPAKIVLGLPVVLGWTYWVIRNIVLRIHDLGYRTWTVLALGVPILNLVFGGMLFLLKGEVGPNDYGNDPTDLGIWEQLQNPPSDRSAGYLKPQPEAAGAGSGSLNLRGR
jgi:uncharacterized membrane protein YhaH (DUF805 family)